MNFKTWFLGIVSKSVINRNFNRIWDHTVLLISYKMAIIAHFKGVFLPTLPLILLKNMAIWWKLTKKQNILKVKKRYFLTKKSHFLLFLAIFDQKCAFFACFYTFLFFVSTFIWGIPMASLLFFLFLNHLQF